MERHSHLAAQFVRALADLVERLADRDIFVGKLHADYSHFGSWELIAHKHHEAIRFTWDGRDGYLTVESSPIRNYSVPNEWREEAVKGFSSESAEAPLSFLEEYLAQRFA